MKRVLLDLNVVLDLFLTREPWHADAAAIWNANLDGRIIAHLASVSLPTLFYVLRKQVGLPLSRVAVSECLTSLTIIPVSISTLRIAEGGPGVDFEDNLQIASAVEAGVEAIITRDPKGFIGSPIPSYSPDELLRLI